jgi:hypothetical protein
MKKKDVINLNDLAEAVVKLEGKKVNLSIAQVKEVIKITLEVLAKQYVGAVLELLARSGKRAEKRAK